MPQLAANWPDLLAKDFTKIYFDRYQQIPVMVPDLFNVMSSDAAYEKTSAVGTVPDFVEFTGRVTEVSPTQELKELIVALVKFDYMLEVPKTLRTAKVKIERILQWIISRKDFFGGLLDSLMVRVG